jgi:N-methylhydantoinase A/oxoprolinase/acetone carboxylase beta subunit
VRRLKIGIDVGGTFTHAVAVESVSLEIVGKVCVPTTHTASEGVARGVVDAMEKLLKDSNIHSEEVVLIAHSTTQATNALLEGDVAAVGIICLGAGVEGLRAKHETELGDIELAPGRWLKTYHTFLDVSVGFSEKTVLKAIQDLAKAGARAMVVSQAFGVDDPAKEEYVVSKASEVGIPATAGSLVSQLYGLRVRTRTAVINASMLPKMLETAAMTERSVRESGIVAPLMIMRSDGGIMDISEMRRRPILTMLSGPAAGVAAALMYVKVSDGIFLEVGGTSTDISVIKQGRPIVKSAEVGRHRLYVKALDIRTIGVAGGSLPRVANRRAHEVGPRSAHIAGLEYAAYSALDSVKGLEIRFVAPLRGDPTDYVALGPPGNRSSHAVTLTDAANVLGLVSEKGYCRGDMQSVEYVMDLVSRQLGTTKETLADRMLQIASDKASVVVRKLLEAHELDANSIMLVGGGGAAEVIVPYLAKRMNLPFMIADNTEVVSAIGAALGMIRETIERNLVDPTEEDILKMRKDAMEAIQKMGASADSIVVSVEVDRQTKRVSAIATGSTEMRTGGAAQRRLSLDELHDIVQRSLGKGSVKLAGGTTFLKVFSGESKRKKFLGMISVEDRSAWVVDSEGVIRLRVRNGVLRSCKVGSLHEAVDEAVETLTTYGDAGALLPDLFLICGGRIVDFTGLIDKAQVLALSRVETEKMVSDEEVLLIAAKKG